MRNVIWGVMAGALLGLGGCAMHSPEPDVFAQQDDSGFGISAAVFESRGVGSSELFSFQGLLTLEGRRVNGPIDLIFQVVDLENEEVLSEAAISNLEVNDGLFQALIPLPLAGDLGNAGSPAVVVRAGDTKKPIVEPILLRRTPLAAASQYADFALQSFNSISADSANSANSAIVANGLADQASIAIPLTAGWTTTRFSNYATSQATRVGGIVHLVGLPERTALTGSQLVIGTLPEGFRPAGRIVLHCEWSIDADGTRVDILPDGRITMIRNITEDEWVSLSGISFPAAQ